MPESEEIGTEPSTDCAICGALGVILYDGLRDVVFGAAGEWTLVCCSQSFCRLLWLNPRPCPQEISKTYRIYYTHADGRNSLKHALRGISRWILGGYLQFHFGYGRTIGPSWSRLLAPFAFPHPAGINPSNLLRLFNKTGFLKCYVRTSNRGAWYILGTSRAIRFARCGRSPGGLFNETSLFTFAGSLNESWGRIIRAFSPRSGEEIVLTACKG